VLGVGAWAWGRGGDGDTGGGWRVGVGCTPRLFPVDLSSVSANDEEIQLRVRLETAYRLTVATTQKSSL
jgi:hypothetical protein